MAFDRLIRAIDEKKNPTVAGLDPKLDYVPEFIKKDSREKYGDTLEAAADALRALAVVAAVAVHCAGRPVVPATLTGAPRPADRPAWQRSRDGCRQNCRLPMAWHKRQRSLSRYWRRPDAA